MSAARGHRFGRGATRAAATALLLWATVRPVGAQGPDSAAIERRLRILHSREDLVQPLIPGLILLGGEDAGEMPAASQHPVRPLTTSQASRLGAARAQRLADRLVPAHDVLAALLVELPHHPAVLTEQARLLLAQRDYAAAERLARAERGEQRDSLLMARELAMALERLGRPRDATGVALEAWLASPLEADWAQATIVRLAPADPRGVRELLHRALATRPTQPGLALVKAQVDWRSGDLHAALETLGHTERPAAGRSPLLWDFAQTCAASGAPRDSGAAVEALVQLAGDARFDAVWRLYAAQRAWTLQSARGARDEAAPALVRALKGVPLSRWPDDFVVEVARGLRLAGRTDEARALVRGLRESPATQGAGAPGGTAGAEVARRVAVPQLDLEEALNDLRDGPPERALPRLRTLARILPEGAWHYAEALFFAGQSDSALAWYQRIAEDPDGAYSGAALERAFLIEDAGDPPALRAFGRIAYEEWRGDRRLAMAMTDSLARRLPRGPLWAQAALLLASQRDAAGDARAALEPLLAVADSLPDDRLAPLARQRAGDLYLLRLGDERAAQAQYEECLARYPRAWNAPEVRRRVEQLRHERRF
jgi:tetratricopeptide (TPR) repeat protein